MTRRSFEDDLAEVAMKRAGEEVLRCPRCDKVILDGVPICRACGHRFGKFSPRIPLKSIMFGLVVVAIVIAFILIR